METIRPKPEDPTRTIVETVVKHYASLRKIPRYSGTQIVFAIEAMLGNEHAWLQREIRKRGLPNTRFAGMCATKGDGVVPGIKITHHLKYKADRLLAAWFTGQLVRLAADPVSVGGKPAEVVVDALRAQVTAASLYTKTSPKGIREEWITCIHDETGRLVPGAKDDLFRALAQAVLVLSEINTIVPYSLVGPSIVPFAPSSFGVSNEQPKRVRIM